MHLRYRRHLGWLLLIIVLLLVVRMLLPYVVRHYLNSRMDRMGDYHGHIVDIDLHLWRGAYSVDDLKVVKVSGKVPVPLLDAPRTDIELSWRALTHGTLRGKMAFFRPVVNFVDGKGEDDTQSGKGVDWRSKLKLLTPMRLDEVNVINGTVTFQNFVSSPRVDLKMTAVNGTASNLTNVERHGGSRVASMQATAKIFGQAPLETHAQFDPLQHQGDFKVDLRVSDIDLTRANQLTRAYAGLDLASGKGDFTMQLEASHGQLNGYAKPLFHNLQIFSWKQDVEQDHKNPLQLAWEAAAQVATSIFKNHAKDQFATRIPISGRIDDKQLGTVDAIINVLRNAFVKAYTPQLEHLKPAASNDKH
ncbi:MAG: DUF748 domain-containing protein [Rhodanobacter sp.]|nr:MAG: DUF748 domain-containing protein [Rhodanobacter sp.]TAM02268.1 MAG: DUF748 domain-containing protein [Rhodanobacter sp.]TAM41210.1 MAG: DUF748 domain-containing protein [Rhodanobacter sp.]TAN25359.1 MAG: DUF748 domain-containing protein [Rhodanobacter sp.]